MSDLTSNYSLKKPLDNEYYDVADQNGNMDLIDVALHGLEASKETPAGAQAKANAAEAAAKAASVPTTRKVNGKALSSDVTITASDVEAISTAQKGSTNGVAELGSDGRVPAAQLPSYVDDVLEYGSMGSFPGTGETGKIYIAQDTNRTYRWGGSSYVEISQSLALGETSSTAYRGDRGKTAYDHSQTVGDAHGLKQAVPVTTSGTGSALTATISGLTLSDGVTLRLKLHTAISAGATLNVNGTSAIAIRDVKGNAVKAGPVAGSYLTLIYNGSNFILQGEGGEYGTAGAAQVLAGYTVGTENGLVSGSIPSKGAQTYTPGTGNQTISAGQYLSGIQTIAGDANLIAGNIKSGVSIFGISGSFTGNFATNDIIVPKLTPLTTINDIGFRPKIMIIFRVSHLETAAPFEFVLLFDTSFPISDYSGSDYSFRVNGASTISSTVYHYSASYITSNGCNIPSGNNFFLNGASESRTIRYYAFG